eukprot:543277-Amorphochlora_amoeboformis.AAC.1
METAGDSGDSWRSSNPAITGSNRVYESYITGRDATPGHASRTFSNIGLCSRNEIILRDFLNLLRMWVSDLFESKQI